MPHKELLLCPFYIERLANAVTSAAGMVFTPARPHRRHEGVVSTPVKSQAAGWGSNGELQKTTLFRIEDMKCEGDRHER